MAERQEMTEVEASKSSAEAGGVTAKKPREIPDGPYIRKVLIAVIVTLLALGVAMLLWWGIRVLMIGFAGVLLAVLLRTLADVVARYTRLPAGWALGVTLIVIVGLFVGLGFLLAPDIATQVNQLVDRLPQAVGKVREQMSQKGWGKPLLALWERVNPMAGGGAAAPTTQAVKQATGLVSSTMGVLFNLLIILFLGIFLAAQPKLYVDGLSYLFPPGMRPRICEVMHRCGHTLRWWLIAQGIDMVVIGALTALGLWALGIPLALTLGVLAALFNFIPNFGPLFSFVPAVLLAMVEGPEKALWVTLLYVALQTIEGYVLLPLLQRGAVDTPPAILIGAQVLLTLLVGGLGLALAAPLAACALVVVKMMYVHDLWGDEVELPGKTEPPRPGGAAI